MQNALSALVIHDIKNALALLEIELEQLNHHEGVPVEGQRAYRRCIELKVRLMGFLTLYKHDQSGLKPMIQEIDPLEFLEDLVEASQSVQMGKNHQGHPISVEVDLKKIKQKAAGFFDENLVELALESALNNAVRYAHREVRVWFEQEGNALTFKVFDDGTGFATEPVRRSSSSTGLGLALCEAVASAHGDGKISIESLPGEGTLFAMTLHRAG